MKYSNKKPPEWISCDPWEKSISGQVLGFLKPVLITFALLFIMVQLLTVLASSIISFETEQKIANVLFADHIKEIASVDNPIQKKLQYVTDKVSKEMDLPKGISITVHYADDNDTANAFALLGGHIIVFKGLLNRVKSEEALAALIAHEIAHIKHRDVTKAALRGIAVFAILSLVDGRLASSLGDLDRATYSRAKESKADEAAVLAVGRLYGHTAGAVELFEILGQLAKETDSDDKSILSTHPHNLKRLTNVYETSKKYDLPTTGKTTKLFQ